MDAEWVAEEDSHGASNAADEEDWIRSGMNHPWGRDQKEPGEWDASMLQLGWGSLKTFDEWASPPSTSALSHSPFQQIDSLPDPEDPVRQRLTLMSRARLMIFAVPGNPDKVPAVITRLTGTYLVLKDLPAVREHFGIEENVLLDVWDVSCGEWRTVPASQPIYVGQGAISILARVHKVHSIPRLWQEIKLAEEGTSGVLRDPRAINMID